jgi:uncharacterized protein (DUF1697 family)
MTIRYAALLRGISPINATMAGLRSAFEAAGFEDVRTILGSGNVVFSARAASESALQKKAERAMQAELGRTFLTIVRPIDALAAMVAEDPFASHRLAPNAKCVVTFLRDEMESVALPKEVHGARILAVRGREVYTAYVPTERGPVFMALLEKTFGQEITTRTWDTVKKIVGAPAAPRGAGSPPARSPRTKKPPKA